MPMYRIAIVDDETEHLLSIEKKIERCMEKLQIQNFECRRFSDINIFWAVLGKGEIFHLLFLDICLAKHRSGLEEARALNLSHPKMSLAFISSHDEYVFDGYETQAMYYFVKPVNEESLLRLLKKDYEDQFITTFLCYKAADGLSRRLEYDKISHIEQYYGNVKIQTNTEKIPCHNTFPELCDLLSGSVLLHCHRSFIVNLTKVRAIQRYCFTMDNNQFVPISKSRFLAIKQRYENYLLGKLEH